METGTATEQMVVNQETQCKLCLIAKTYQRYALKTTNQEFVSVVRNLQFITSKFCPLLSGADAEIRIYQAMIQRYQALIEE